MSFSAGEPGLVQKENSSDGQRHRRARRIISSLEPFGDPVNIGVKQKFAKLALRRTDPKEVTQMVTDRKKDSDKTPRKTRPGEGSHRNPIKSMLPRPMTSMVRI